MPWRLLVPGWGLLTCFLSNGEPQQVLQRGQGRNTLQAFCGKAPLQRGQGWGRGEGGGRQESHLGEGWGEGGRLEDIEARAVMGQSKGLW